MASKEAVQRQIMTLREGIAKLAGLLANRGCRVVYEGSRCCTDGDTIYLPAVELLESSEKSEEEVLELVRNFVGYVYHEVSHILFTTWHEWRGRLPSLAPQVRGLANAIEDCYVERKMQTVWQGSDAPLTAVHRYVAQCNAAAYKQMDTMGQVTMLVAFLGRGPQRYRWVCDHFDPRVVLWVDSHLTDDIEAIERVKSTSESIDLAEQIYRKICEQVKSEQQAKKKQKKQEQEEKKQEEKKQEQEQEEIDSVETVDLEDCESVEDRYYEPPEGSAETLAKQFREFTSHRSAGDCVYVPYTRKGDVNALIEDDDTHRCDDADMARALVDLDNVAVHIVGPLRSSLARVLKARSTAYRVRDLEHGRLDRRRLWKVPMGAQLPQSPRVRAQEIQQETFDELAVVVCVNESGSMADYAYRDPQLGVFSRMDLAKVAALALGDVLHVLGVRFAMCGHTTRGFARGKSRFSNASRYDQNRFTRWGDHVVSWVKMFDQDWRRRRRYVAVMHAVANTFDAETLQCMAREVGKQRVDRRVILLLDDGLPCPNVHEKYVQHFNALKREARQVRNRGIECVGVGIASDSVKQFYPDHIVVRRLELLPDQILEKFGELLGAYRKGA